MSDTGYEDDRYSDDIRKNGEWTNPKGHYVGERTEDDDCRDNNREAEKRQHDYLDRCDNRRKWESKHNNTNYPKDSRYW